jgi:uncharacterized protein YutD
MSDITSCNYELATNLGKFLREGRLNKNIKGPFLEVINLLDLDFVFDKLSQMQLYGQYLINKTQDLETRLKENPGLLYECCNYGNSFWVNIYDFREVGGRDGAVNLFHEIEDKMAKGKHCATCTCKEP